MPASARVESKIPSKFFEWKSASFLGMKPSFKEGYLLSVSEMILVLFGLREMGRAAGLADLPARRCKWVFGEFDFFPDSRLLSTTAAPNVCAVDSKPKISMSFNLPASV